MRPHIKRGSTIAAASALAALAALSSALAQTRVEVGVLTCNARGSQGFIIGSTKNLTCRFERAAGGVETYTGTIRKFGLDIGVTGETVIAWAVLGPRSGVGPGALAGGYGGVSAEATVGVGLGANAMIGGFNRSIVLQPLSVQAQEGLNLAAGISSIDLNYLQ